MDHNWFNDEAFWREGYPFMFSDEAFRRAHDDVERLIALTGITGGRVLDLGCGPGRHAVPLAKRRFTVTGVDTSRFLLTKAQAHADEAGVAVEFVRDDMRTFRRPGVFDFAISMFNSFGYFADRADDRQVAAHLQHNVRGGGMALIEVMGKELTMGRYANVTQAEGVTRVEQHQVIDNWTRVRSQWIFIRENSVERFEYCVRIYSGQELSDLLREVGFADVTLYGDLDGRSYAPGATRLIAVARKA